MGIFLFERDNKDSHNIRHKIVIIEALIFILPFLCLLYIIYHGNYNFESSHAVVFVGMIIFVLAGMIILRQILSKISDIALSFKKADVGNAVAVDIHKDVTELHEISTSLNTLLQKLEHVTAELAQKSFELSTINNLTEIIRDNLSIDDQMSILLEKCVTITRAKIGSVFIVEPEIRQNKMAVLKSTPLSMSQLYRFRVCAAVGHGETLKKGSLIDIENSVAKAVLLGKSPLVVRDISEDLRTLKTNDPKYGAPSFLSIPIIIENSVSLIVNLSCKENGQLFDNNDEQVISIILRDVGFAITNTTLQTRIKEQLEKIKRHDIELEREIEKRKRIERVMKNIEGNDTPSVAL
jgi:two-component system cell cycle sensor histidine kinase/response regulator CckA